MNPRQLITGLLTFVFLLQSSIMPSVAQSPVARDSSIGIMSTHSQANLNTISGRVIDDNGNGIAGVTVTATMKDTKYPIILLPGVMGTALGNEPSCGDRPNGTIWINSDRLGDLSPFYLNNEGAGPRDECDNIVVQGRIQVNVSIRGVTVREIKPYEAFVDTAQSPAYGYQVLPYLGYDWRLSVADSVSKLDTFIDQYRGDTSHLCAHKQW